MPEKVLVAGTQKGQGGGGTTGGGEREVEDCYEGFVEVHVKRGSDESLDATIVVAHPGEMISEVTPAMAGRSGLKKLAAVIHPYPTRAEAIKQVAEAYNRTRLTPGHAGGWGG